MRFIGNVAALSVALMLLAGCSISRNYQAWVSQAFPADGPGGTVILVRNDEVLFHGAAGLANVELGVAMRPDHVLRIGSITKQFTAAAIMLLHDRGQLNVADEISRYLPEFPSHGRGITISHLLAHTSGIYSYTDSPGYWRSDLLRTDVSPDEILQFFAHKPIQFPPGNEFSYSNSGYALLGLIIERVSGIDYEEFLRREIVEPLGLNGTYYGGLHIVPMRASGYHVDRDGKLQNAFPLSMTHAYAAGGLLSTVEDLARWNAALMSGRLLGDESVQAMTTVVRLNDGTENEYGYGFYVRERDGLLTISHPGGIHGFSASAVWLPQKRIYAAVLTNLEDSSKANELVWKLAMDAAN